MKQYLTYDQIKEVTGRAPHRIGVRIVNEQIADTIKYASDCDELPQLEGATWRFKQFNHSLDQHGNEYNTFRFESETKPAVNAVVDITDEYLFGTEEGQHERV